MTKSLIVIAHDIRSAHNVGALLRTAEGLGILKVYLTGYTPYPISEQDTRLPHIATKLTQQIHKTALGAETTDLWEHADDVHAVLEHLHSQGYIIAGLEQTPDSIQLNTYKTPEKLVILLGSEVTGIAPELLPEVDLTLEIPMSGEKESFNVVEAASMAMYHCRYAT